MLPAPQLRTNSPSNDTIQLDWEPLEDAVLYSLTVILQGSNIKQSLNSTSTSETLVGLQPGSTYCITALAWDAEGRTGDSIEVCQLTREAALISSTLIVLDSRDYEDVKVKSELFVPSKNMKHTMQGVI